MKRPIILCGLGRMGAHVLDYLRAADLPVVVVDAVCRPDDARCEERGSSPAIAEAAMYWRRPASPIAAASSC